MQGKIKKVLHDFGFIIPDGGGVDVYFHCTNVQPDIFARLAPGHRVAFETRTGSRGKPEAFNLAVEPPNTSDQHPASGASNGAPTRPPAATPPTTLEVLSGPPAAPEKEKEAHPQETEESEDTVKHSKWGTVRRFDKQKGSGHITPRDGGDDIFVLFRNIVGIGFKTLFQNEQVLYDIEQDRNGKPWAVNVRPAPVPISNGKVLTFDEDLERGTIQPNEGGEPVNFNAEGVLDKDLSEYEEGDLVKYRLVQADSGPVPVRITRLVDPRLPLERFADLSDFDRLLARLANPNTGAAQEEWNYRIKPSSFPYPILENYLHYTFKRIEQEKKIGLGKNRRGEPIACFNTGLATPKQDELYAFFTKAKRKRSIVVSKSTLAAPEWVLEGFFRGTEGPMIDIPKMPELASYFEGTSFKNLVFDHSLDFRIRMDHILRDRRDRFLELPNLPPSLRDDPDALADRFDTALNLAKRRVRRNYKTAIPTFNRGKINMLLPLCIVSKDQADLALLVERKSDYDGKIDYYIGWTVLTLDMAYNNARLLARPDTEWLTP